MSLRIALLLSLLLCTGCLSPTPQDDDDDDDDDDDATEESYSVVIDDAPPAELVVGDTYALVARAFDSSGEVSDPPLSWATSDSGIATISSSGLLTALGAGEVTITVTFEGESDSASTTVIEACPVGETITWEGNSATRQVPIVQGPCIGEGGGYITNLGLSMPETRSLFLYTPTANGVTPTVTIYPLSSTIPVFELTSPFSGERTTLDAGEYRIAVSSVEPGAEGTVELYLEDACVYPVEIRLGTIGSQQEPFSIGNGDCYSNGNYRVDFGFHVGANSHPYILDFDVVFDWAVNLDYDLDAGWAGSQGGELPNSTGFSWNDDVHGDEEVTGTLRVDQPVTGTMYLSRTSNP